MTFVRIFLPFAFGYFLSYLYRVVNAVIAPDLVRDLGLDAAGLGLLTSAYFLTFAAFQLPLGILLDRFGPRRTEAGLLLFAAAGGLVFSQAETTFGLIAGRALIGFGVSACLMAAFKAFVMWFPSERLPLVNGIQMAAGGLGALTGTVPVEAALGFVDWRTMFVAVAGVTVAASVLIYTVVPERPADRPRTSFGDQLRGVGAVFSSPVFWRIAPPAIATQAAFLSIQSLWAGPWLKDVGGLDRAGVAEHLLLIAVAMIAGFLGIGAAAERLSRRGVGTATVAAWACTAFIVVQAAIVFRWTDAVLPLWMAFGFLGTTAIVFYAALSQSFPAHLAGRANTGLNVLVFSAAFGAQWGIGAVIDLWPAAADGGYAADAYATAFGVLLVPQVLALIWFAVFRGAEART